MKFKLSKKWSVILIIILIIIGYNVVKGMFKSPTEGLLIEKATRGDVVREISETGSVKATNEISLGFKSIGKVSKILVESGSKVKRGDVLAELDSSQLLAQLRSAQASLNYTANQHDTGVAAAQDDLQSAYNSARNVLTDAYTKTYNAFNVAVDLENNYFSTTNQEGIRVSDGKNDIQQNMQKIKEYLDKATSNSQIDLAISETLVSLDNIYNDLKIIRSQCDSGIYYYSVSSAYKTSLDTQKTNINTAKTNLTTSQTDISSYKIALQKAEDRATDTTTGSQVEQAEANVNLYQSQLNDAYLRAPIDGIITEVNMKRGEIVSSSQVVINLLSTEPFEIRANIYEQDIVSVEVGDSVQINLVAFPKQTFIGKVSSIDPAETIIDNVVYYKITIDFPDQPKGIRSGMTADIIIETERKEGVLRVSKSAVSEIDGQALVQVVRGRKIEDQKITTGLEGSDYLEIKTGLSEGEEVVIGKK